MDSNQSFIQFTSTTRCIFTLPETFTVDSVSGLSWPLNLLRLQYWCPPEITNCTHRSGKQISRMSTREIRAGIGGDAEDGDHLTRGGIPIFGMALFMSQRICASRLHMRNYRCRLNSDWLILHIKEIMTPQPLRFQSAFIQVTTEVNLSTGFKVTSVSEMWPTWYP